MPMSGRRDHQLRALLKDVYGAIAGNVELIALGISFAVIAAVTVYGSDVRTIFSVVASK